MKRLLGIEYYKVKHHKLSRILFISYFVLLTSIALISAIKFKIGEVEIHLAEQGIFNFPYIWHFNTWVADVLTFFIAIIVVSMITNEYNFRTIKQNLIDGLSKKEFLLSKFYFVIALSLIATFFVFIISLILGLMYSDYTSMGIVFSEIYFLPAFFLKLLGTFTLILLFGILLKRSAYALGFFFIWIVLEGILYGLLRWKFFNEQIANSVSSYFPYMAIKNLLPEPFTRLSAAKTLGKQIGQELEPFSGVSIEKFLIVLVWIAIFLTISYKIIKKRDL
jgi:ABC-type transport system involved in multi-copper enzyme maturation permease subunit